MHGVPQLEDEQAPDYLIYPYLPKFEAHLIAGGRGSGVVQLLFQLLAEWGIREDIFYISGIGSDECSRLEFDPDSRIVHLIYDSVGDHFWNLDGADNAPWLSDGDKFANHIDPTWPFRWLNKRYPCPLSPRDKELAGRPKLMILDPAERFIPCADLTNYKALLDGIAAIDYWAAGFGTTAILVWRGPLQPALDNVSTKMVLTDHDVVLLDGVDCVMPKHRLSISCIGNQDREFELKRNERTGEFTGSFQLGQNESEQ